MKIRSGLKAGKGVGYCYPVYNKLGMCKKLICPFPPYELSCYDEEPVREGPRKFESGS